MPVAKCRSPHPQTNLSPAPLGKKGVHELPLLHRHLPVAQSPHYSPLAALTRAILHKVQVNRSEGNTLQVMYRGSVEGDCAPASPQLPPITGRELWGNGDRPEEQASFRPKLERTKWLYWGGGNHPAPPFLPPTYVHVLRGCCGSWDLRGPSPACGSCGGTSGWGRGLGGLLPAKLSRPRLWGWRQWRGSWGCARVRAR